jgi:hypothetical protein
MIFCSGRFSAGTKGLKSTPITPIKFLTGFRKGFWHAMAP